MSQSQWDVSRDLGPYIETHLSYELKYLLVAATTWSAVSAAASRGRWPDHLVEMAMESAFVHTRTLCIFLTKKEGWSNRSPHVAPPRLPLWGRYGTPMNRKVLHPDPIRPYQSGVFDGDDLKDRVVDLAQEVLTAWNEVARQSGMASFQGVMVEARNGAVADSARAAARMEVQPVFT